ncbi:putative transcriptional regulator dj-1 [Globisporangium polare]
MTTHNEHASGKPHVKPRALIVIADGSGELETLVLSDVLTRSDMHVSIASVGYRSYELIVLPGGLSVNRLHDCDLLTKMLKKQRESGSAFCDFP